ncbi:MAG: hypothetical protein ACTSV3_05045 [Candidatus Thorarchaeota archaeon]
MSRTERKNIQTSSTVEAIRMASASVLGTTTGLGYPIGSAIGSGNVLEEHSGSVAGNVAPLIFAIRDTLMSAENLELLSIEWDLERTPGPDVLPEQLVVAGGSEGGTGSHVCVLTWEKGVVDPFKIDEYMRVLSKKIGDIETAVINNELNYDLEGLAVLQRFADRLNSVLYVDMIDRRFQGSWDSLQVKADHVDVDMTAKMLVRDDFTLFPPGMRVVGRKELEFRLPSSTTDDAIEHFKHRVLTPSAVDTLTVDIPETGQAILRELNEYAYAQEEEDIVEGLLGVLRSFLGLDEIPLNEIANLQPRIDEFADHLASVVNSLEHIVEAHLSSGKSLTVDGHKSALVEAIGTSDEPLSGIRKDIAVSIVEQMSKSVSREILGAAEIRAWELKSSLRYSIDYAKKVAQYFTSELGHYLVIEAARKTFAVALKDFRSESLSGDMASADAMLFEKFYSEVKAQLDASFAKKSYSGEHFADYRELMSAVSRDMIDAFRNIDVWSLVNFEDVADVAQAEIEAKHSVPEGTKNLTERGNSLQDLLEDFKTLVSETIPDVADTILSKPLVRRIIERMRSEGTSVVDELAHAIEGASEKSDEWKDEAKRWAEDFRAENVAELDAPHALLALLQFIHEDLGAATTPSAIADRVKAEADAMESAYLAKVQEWEQICAQIEQENHIIRERNEKREQLLREVQERYESELAQYEAELRHFNDKMEQRRIRSVSVLSEDGSPSVAPPVEEPLPVEPTKPEPLEPKVFEIKAQYPEGELKPLPEKPQPDPKVTLYIELRDLLHGKLADMKERENVMEEAFARRVLRLQAEGLSSTESVSVNLSKGFLDHLMSSRIRGLGRLLPRISRVYLRDPKTTDLLYLVSYRHFGDNLTITVGSTFLR